MIYKHALLTLALTGCFAGGQALADDTTPVENPIASQCKELAALTPMDIFSKTQNGVSSDYNDLAQDCFKQNVCSTLENVDKPTCARSIALNSYLINVAYQTKGPAYPPYPTYLQNNTPAPSLPVQPTPINQPTAATQSTYSNLAAPDTSATITTPPNQSIKWS